MADPSEEIEATIQNLDAVITVIRKGREAEDTDIGRLFYLAQDIKDALIVNPETGAVIHARHDQTPRLASEDHADIPLCMCHLHRV